MNKLPKHYATNWKQNERDFSFRSTRGKHFCDQTKKLNDLVFQFRNADKSLMTTLPELCQQFASLLNRGDGNDRECYCGTVESCAGQARFGRHQKILDPNLATGRLAQSLCEFHRDASLALQDQRQMGLGAAAIGRQFCLANLFMPVEPGGERVLRIHDHDFAIGKVYLSSITLLAGNGHTQPRA